ncbi:MAG: TPM domain-containing protein [Methylovulum sp.]|uniref:TPM domain-containing protein n=1 Tax=Methylovulum sp. TaxID=1916980 RepID=UPI002613D508|nr:TPM domain-containing protein [Methylovulum sp.]MDD2723803.1 TPM domain-containing protein [Methylovulum sp.]MDD5125967.1 TPM domain-containing protein [Methylovulum sp.]
MVNSKRWLIHTFTPPWRWHWTFPKATLKAIEEAVKLSETQHSGELRFAIETTLPSARVWHGLSARQRATELFAKLRVWDTEENSGVLIYLQLADREVHILADRGINKRVRQAEWDAVALAMEGYFRQGDFLRGSLEGIGRITGILAAHFPANADNPDELPNQPVIIRR